MHAGDHKCRRHDIATDVQSGTDALHQRRLAGAERTGQHDEVTSPEHRGEPLPERTGVGDRWQHDGRPTGGLGAHSTIEAVGTQESMMQAIRATRAGGHVGYVGVSHDVSLDGLELFFSGVHLHGGPAPVRRFLPQLIQLIWDRKIDPGKVFDLTLSLDQAAEGYKAMDQRTATKVLLTV